jgi:hypothetical protein
MFFLEIIFVKSDSKSSKNIVITTIISFIRNNSQFGCGLYTFSREHGFQRPKLDQKKTNAIELTPSPIPCYSFVSLFKG